MEATRMRILDSVIQRPDSTEKGRLLVAVQSLSEDDLRILERLMTYEGRTDDAIIEFLQQKLADVPPWFAQWCQGEFKDLRKAVADSLSTSRSASKTEAAELSHVRHTLKVTLEPDDKEQSLDELLGAEPSADDKAFWSEELEEQQRDAYAAEIAKHIPQRRQTAFELVDRKRKTEAVHYPGMTFELKGRTHELVILRRYHDQPPLGAIAGVELKKRLRWSAFYQAQAQWFLYAPESNFPYCRFVTDLERGGVAFYCPEKNQTGHHRLLWRVFVGMEAFWEFFEAALRAVPEELMPVRGWPKQTPIELELDSPKRIKFEVQREVAAGSLNSLAARVVMQYQDGQYGDVACLKDLEGFKGRHVVGLTQGEKRRVRRVYLELEDPRDQAAGLSDIMSPNSAQGRGGTAARARARMYEEMYGKLSVMGVVKEAR